MNLFPIFKFLLPLSLLLGIGLFQRANLTSIKGDSLEEISEFDMQQQSEASALRFQLLSNLPDFGFSNLVSSWTFLNFLQYFGDSEMREQTGYLLSPSFFEIITDRDPGFIDSYIYLANSISMYAGQPRESIRLMEQGLSELSPETVPRSYLVWRHKATDELLFVRDTQAAQISYATAADWAERSADPDAANIAAASNQTAVFLANEPNSKPAQISAWSQVLLRATDDTIREAAISNIEALGGRVLLAENGQVTVRYRSEE